MSAVVELPGQRAAADALSVAFVGSGGAGVMTAGSLLLQAAAAAGCYGLMVRAAGPQIRGGESAALLRIADHDVACLDDRIDVLVALDWDHAERFIDEIALDASSLVISPSSRDSGPEAFVQTGARFVPLDFAGMSAVRSGSWPNMVALGVAAAALLGLLEGRCCARPSSAAIGTGTRRVRGQPRGGRRRLHAAGADDQRRAATAHECRQAREALRIG